MIPASSASTNWRLTDTELRELNERLLGRYIYNPPTGGMSLPGTDHLETVIHELSHCAVFDMLPTKNIGPQVSEAFERYVDPLWSDLSECRALAVEILVARALCLRLEAFRLIRSAATDMASDRYHADPKAVWATISSLVGFVAQRRAERVLGWLKTDIEAVRSSRRRSKENG